MNHNKTRESIIEAADQLIYEQGYEHTSFAHIATSVQISRGNFYYHFKSKDEILDAVIKQRLAKTQKMLERWEKDASHPAERIKSYLNIVLTNWDKIQHFGCPVGTLCTELAKLNHASKREASEIFTLFRNWLGHQFSLLGHESVADSLAMHVLAWSQGVATLASTFQDAAFVQTEVKRITDWLDSLT